MSERGNFQCCIGAKRKSQYSAITSLHRAADSRDNQEPLVDCGGWRYGLEFWFLSPNCETLMWKCTVTPWPNCSFHVGVTNRRHSSRIFIPNPVDLFHKSFANLFRWRGVPSRLLIGMDSFLASTALG